jgi:predicted MPP superfamily phosphohydrolase
MISRRTMLKGLAGCGLAATAGGGAYGYEHGREPLSVTRETLELAAWPEALNGFTIGLLTDIHRSRWVSHEDVALAVATLMAERPDLIVLGGDYVTEADRAYMDPAADALAALSAPYGVHAILGNHDDDRVMPAALARCGFDVLRDARTHLTIKGEGIELVGIRYWQRRSSDIAKLVRSAESPVILLAHDPRRLSEAAQLQVPLVLSGHTHGGQIVLPALGAIAAQRFPVVAGVGHRNHTAIFVSRGIGTVYVPVRINCPPEAAVLTLRHQVSEEEFRKTSGSASRTF